MVIRCDPRAYAQCPTHEACGPCAADCEYMEGSDCDLFNQHILSRPMTGGDKIRAMSNDEMARAAAKEVLARSTEFLASNGRGFSATEMAWLGNRLYDHYYSVLNLPAEV